MDAPSWPTRTAARHLHDRSYGRYGPGMEWTILLNTALGGILAIGGGLGGALMAERRADARENRSREHERKVWARNLRHEAHLTFMRIFDERYMKISEAKNDPTSPETPDDYLGPVWIQFESLRLVCEPPTAKQVQELMTSLREYAYANGRWEYVEYHRDNYLGAVREELGLPRVPLMGD